ncbi:MAG: hypothetical protein JWM16_4557 [Verrucomicrobiales bacterium]|nr:hypothetical protein [Verrucomicrobiales bacterium]
MCLIGIAVEAQGVDVGVGFLDFGNLLAGEIGREAFLPELVFAFDFALGLGSLSLPKFIAWE